MNQNTYYLIVGIAFAVVALTVVLDYLQRQKDRKAVVEAFSKAKECTCNGHSNGNGNGGTSTGTGTNTGTGGTGTGTVITQPTGGAVLN